MKFFIYNPEPLNNCTNPACNGFHSKTRDPSHIFDCYKKEESSPINFQCSNRIHKLSEPHRRHVNNKFVNRLGPSSAESYVPKGLYVSNRLDHLAAPIFRRIYTTRQNIELNGNINDSVKQNLDLHIQRSMFNVYSRLQNVKFPNTMDWRRKPLRKSIKPSSDDCENRRMVIDRLSQPRKIPQLESPIKLNEQTRPISMEVIKRLSTPRKIRSPEQINYAFPSRPLRSDEYYEMLSQPRKISMDLNDRGSEPKLSSMKRTNEMAVPLSRLQKRKFMKGDNETKFPISKAALEYKASAKISKLAVPKKIPGDPNRPASKSKRKK